MSNFVKKHWKTLFVVVAFAWLGWTLRHSGRDFAALPKPSLVWLIAAFVMFLIHYLIQACGWHLILRSLGQATTPRLSMRMFYMSMIARWMPGRVLYTATRLMLARQNGLSVTAVSFAMVMELVFILVAGVIVTISFAGSLVKSLFAGSHGTIALVVLASVVFLCAALVIKPSTLLKMYEIKLFRKAMRKVAGEDLDAGSMPKMTTASSLLLLAYFSIFWLYSGVMFAVLAYAFLPGRGLPLLASIPSFCGSWLVGFFSLITPAGMGVREGAMWLMLKGSIGQSEAGMLAIASRLVMMFAEIFSVCVASLVLGTKLLPNRSGSVDLTEAANLKDAKGTQPASIPQLSSLVEAEG